MPREFFRDMVCGGWMAGQVRKDGAALIEPGIGVTLAENDLIARLV